jgi:hypothetical protein
MFKKITIFFISFFVVFATRLENAHKTFQRVLHEDFVECAEELMKIERWGDNSNVYKIAFEITQTKDPYNYYKLYAKLSATKKTAKVMKIFGEMSDIIAALD